MLFDTAVDHGLTQWSRFPVGKWCQAGRMADEMFPVRNVLPAQVDAESVSWPARMRDAAFGEYLEAGM
jgi:hypothetical protein